MDIMGSPEKDLNATIASTEPITTNAPTPGGNTLIAESQEKNADPAVDERFILTGRKLVLAHTGFLMLLFCIALDQLVVSTALPKLASQFDALDRLPWVVSVYFLTTAGLVLLFGQLLTVLVAKWVYISSLIIFEAGSLICALAPNMNVLIFGRAVQGVGASGSFTAVLVIFAQITKLETRPILMGTFGATFGISSVAGPLIGGALTDHATWRWCFYINLPLGGISILTALLFQPANPPPGLSSDTRTIGRRLASIDWVGAALSIGSVTSLLLALQWGGVTKPWNNKDVIALFVVFAVLLVAFIAWEYRMKAMALMPLSLLSNRSEVGACCTSALVRVSFLAANFYLPLFYQAKGRSASQSGVSIIPLMLSLVIIGILGSVSVKRTGHYYSIIIIGPLIACVGAGLLFTIDEYTSSPRLIGYQILFGAGIGLAFQLPVLAIQAEYADRPDMVPRASSLVMFFQMLGASISIAIAGAIFNNQLSKQVPKYAPSLTPELVAAVKQSVLAVFQLEPALRASVVHAYVKSLDYVFILAIPAGALASLSAAFIRNWDIRTRGVESRKPATTSAEP